MSRQILLATRNRDKVRELDVLLSPLRGLEILSLEDIGLPGSPAENALESSDSFLGNAFAKAEYFHHLSGLPTLSDDSGLVVPALAGAPGVHSRRFCGRDDLEAVELDRRNNELLLERLAGTAPAQRASRYVCVAALVSPGVRAAAAGTLRGEITRSPAGSGGFGYDPLFQLPGGRTVAQLTVSEKNGISHRARAFRALAPRLATLLSAR